MTAALRGGAPLYCCNALCHRALEPLLHCAARCVVLRPARRPSVSASRRPRQRSPRHRRASTAGHPCIGRQSAVPEALRSASLARLDRASASSVWGSGSSAPPALTTPNLSCLLLRLSRLFSPSLRCQAVPPPLSSAALRSSPLGLLVVSCPWTGRDASLPSTGAASLMVSAVGRDHQSQQVAHCELCEQDSRRRHARCPPNPSVTRVAAKSLTDGLMTELTNLAQAKIDEGARRASRASVSAISDHVQRIRSCASISCPEAALHPLQ